MRRLKEIAEREQQKAFTQHERVVDQHMHNVRSIRRRADAAEKTAATVKSVSRMYTPGARVLRDKCVSVLNV